MMFLSVVKSEEFLAPPAICKMVLARPSPPVRSTNVPEPDVVSMPQLVSKPM